MHEFANAVGRRHRAGHVALGSARLLRAVVVACVSLALCCHSVRAEGIIQAILDSVRGDSGGESTEPAPPRATDPPKSQRPAASSDESALGDGLGEACFHLMFYTVTSPFWLPSAALEDAYTLPAYFPRFPYDNVDGHLAEGPSTPAGRAWSGRFSVEYLEPFSDANGISGRLLLSTTSRFGLDAEASHFQERRPQGGCDWLWVGDYNLVFRFAQAEKAEFRAGLGFNWLDASDAARRQSDFGFNFTYGADFFPRKPWVFSADLDAGNLGSAALFRFRATGGILLKRIEAYTGYEYLDIGRGQFNLLVTGLRAWF